MKRSLLIISLFVAFISCEKEVSVTTVAGVITTDLGEPNTIQMSNSAEVKTFNIEVNAKWSITSSDDWAVVKPSSGEAGKHTITVSASKNESNTERKAVLIIILSDASTIDMDVSKRVNVIQAKYDGLVLSGVPESPFSSEGGLFEITVPENAGTPEVKIDDESKAWIDVVPAGEGENKSIVKFIVKRNETNKKRTGEVVVTAGGQKASFNVDQLQVNALIISKDNTDALSPDESIFELLVFENVGNPTIAMSDGLQEWLTQVPSARGLVSHKLSFKVGKNETNGKRSGTVTITAGGLKESFDVTQLQNDALIISTGITNSLSAEGAKFNVSILENIGEPTVIMSDGLQEWLTQVPSARGLTSHELSFSVSKNETDKKRVGTVTITAGGLQESFDVTQLGVNTFEVLGIPETIESGGGQFTLTVNHNLTESSRAIIISGNEWLTESSVVTRDVTTNLHHFTVKENSSTISREGSIRIEIGSLDTIVQIKQFGLDENISLHTPKHMSLLFKEVGTTILFDARTDWRVRYTGDTEWFQVKEAVGLPGKNQTIHISSGAHNLTESDKILTVIITAQGVDVELKITQHHRYIKVSNFLVFDRNVGSPKISQTENHLGLNWINGIHSQAAFPENYKYKGTYWQQSLTTTGQSSVYTACSEYLGGGLILPSKSQMEEIVNKLEHDNGAIYLRATYSASAIATIYFPVTGHGDDQNIKRMGYWTSSESGDKGWIMTSNVYDSGSFNPKLLEVENTSKYPVRCIKVVENN